MNSLTNGTTTSMDASTRNTSMVSSANISSMAYWGILPSLQVVVCPCVIILNGTILFLFITKPHLRQPFYIYLANLLIANICFNVLSTPFDIINTVYRSWWLGNIACTAKLYGSFVVAPAIFHSHLLITINRLWAVRFPHSFRNNNTKRMAFILCVSGWVYVNCLCLPLVILDALYYRLPTDAGCFFNVVKLGTYNLALQFPLYLLPNFIIIAAYPYLWWMIRRRRFRIVIQPGRNDNTGEHAIPSTTQATAESNAVIVPTGARRSDGENHHAFAVLTLLTISVTFCWTPANILFTMGSADLEINYQSAVFQVSMVLFILQPLLDPILFVATLPELRKALFGLFVCCKNNSPM